MKLCPEIKEKPLDNTQQLRSLSRGLCKASSQAWKVAYTISVYLTFLKYKIIPTEIRLVTSRATKAEKRKRVERNLVKELSCISAMTGIMSP